MSLNVPQGVPQMSPKMSPFYGYCSYRIMGCYLQKKSKEILLIHAPTSADYLSVCSFWKHIGKNWE